MENLSHDPPGDTINGLEDIRADLVTYLFQLLHSDSFASFPESEQFRNNFPFPDP